MPSQCLTVPMLPLLPLDQTSVATHVFATQTARVGSQAPLVQQASPARPHGWQTPPPQIDPGSQDELVQQGAPTAPQRASGCSPPSAAASTIQRGSVEVGLHAMNLSRSPKQETTGNTIRTNRQQSRPDCSG